MTILFAPFMHVMDKFAYGRHLKRTGQRKFNSKPEKVIDPNKSYTATINTDP